MSKDYSAEHIGIREGRRIHGRYKVTLADMESGARPLYQRGLFCSRQLQGHRKCCGYGAGSRSCSCFVI
jgi:hypothetical protein